MCYSYCPRLGIEAPTLRTLDEKVRLFSRILDSPMVELVIQQILDLKIPRSNRGRGTKKDYRQLSIVLFLLAS